MLTFLQNIQNSKYTSEYLKTMYCIVKVLQIYAMTNLWDFNRACAVLVNSFLQIVQRASHLLDFASFSLRNPAIFQ